MLVAMGGGIFVALTLVALVVLSVQTARELDRATQSYLEEQRMADEIAHGVMDQFATAPFFQPRSPGASPQPLEPEASEATDGGVVLPGPPMVLPPSPVTIPLPGVWADDTSWPLHDLPAAKAEFQAAGEEVYRNLRQYLFRDLSTEQRLQLEAMSEEHQRMEVAASRAIEMRARGDEEGAHEAHSAMADRALSLLEASRNFLAMREEDLSELRDQQAATYQRLVASGGGLMLLIIGGSLGLVWFFHRRVDHALGTLADASERLEAGDLNVHVPLGRDLEFQEVSAHFNRMARSVRRTTLDLRRQNRELMEALDHLRETQAELIQSEKLNAMGRMSAGIAHEINNPLGSILGYAQALDLDLQEGRTFSPEELRETYLAPILQEGERARMLVRTVLRFSRRSSTELSPVNLRDCVEVVAQLRRHAFQKAGLELALDLPPNLHVLAEEQTLQSAFLNLVNNALDAMRPQASGRLRIGVHGMSAEKGADAT